MISQAFAIVDRSCRAILKFAVKMLFKKIFAFCVCDVIINHMING